VRRPRQVAAFGVLLAPFVLAFRSGGYFAEPRLWAGVGMCALAAVAVVVSPLPRRRWTWVALAGLAGLAAWTLASMGWAPLAGAALDDAQRLVLYAAAFAAAALLLGAVPRVVEPALLGGCVVVVAYGLAERLLPGIVELSASRTAFGRLEQPLTYWNAMGLLAALGLLLGIRLAGDPSRRAGLRAAAAAATVPLGLGLVLTFSRGSLAALAVGIGVMCWLAPSRAQLRAAALAIAAAVLTSAVALPLDGVRALAGEDGRREDQGLVMLAVLLGVMVAAAALARRPLPHGEIAGRGRLVMPLAATAAVAALLATLSLVGGPTAGTPEAGADPGRLVSLESNRYRYWEIALTSFADHPARGVGSGGFRVEWRRERSVADPARDAHSLYLETAAELGVVGLGLLALWLAGIVGAARDARGRVPAATVGPIAALALWAVHAGVDWDWEMPAVTLVAIVLAGLLCALSEPAEQAG